MKKFFSGFLVLCLSFALLTACGKGGQTGKTVTAGGLTFAKSYSEVYSALTDAQKAIADRDKSLNMSDAASSEPETGGKGDGEGTFYSGTNVQVAGVDEGDIVKTDGTYIYILRGSELIVMQADGADVTDVSNVFVGQDWERTTTEDGRAHTQEKLPLELYLVDGRAVVLSSYTDWTCSDTSSDELSGSGNNYVTVDIYDVSDPAAPTLVQSLGQPVGLHGEDELAALGAGGVVGRDERRRRDGPRERHLPERQMERHRLVSCALRLKRRAAAALADHAAEVEFRAGIAGAEGPGFRQQ